MFFVIRQIEVEGSERKPVLFFEDQGEATHLAANRYDDLTQLLRFIYAQVRHQAQYRPELRAEIFQFRNRGGAYVPLCIRAGKAILGIIPMLTENPQPGLFATARSFLKTYSGAKLLLVHQGKSDRVLDADSRIRSIGVSALL